jgi:hypothetical protein
MAIAASHRQAVYKPLLQHCSASDEDGHAHPGNSLPAQPMSLAQRLAERTLN